MVASCFRRMGNHHKALELYEEIHSDHPENVECEFNLPPQQSVTANEELIVEEHSPGRNDIKAGSPVIRSLLRSAHLFVSSTAVHEWKSAGTVFSLVQD